MCVLRHVWLFATPWSVACQVLLSMRLSRQEQWSGSPFPPPGNLPDPGIEPESLMSAALAGRFFPTHATLEALVVWEEESNTTNPHNWGGRTGEEKHTSPTPFSKSLLSDAFSLSHALAPPHQWRDKPVLLALTGSSPKGFILTSFQVSIQRATFCFSTPPILPLPPWVTHACILWFIFSFMFMCQERRSEKGNKTHCCLFQCTATGKHFTAHPLPCNFYCLAADKEASIDAQDRCTIEFPTKRFLLGFVNRFDNSFQEIAPDVSRLDLAVKHAES